MGAVPHAAQGTGSQETDVLRLTTIRARLLFSFALVALVPVLAVSLASSAVAYYTGRRQVSDRLESLAALRQSTIRSWIHDLEQDLVIASNTDCAFERITVVLTLAEDYKHYGFYNRAVRKRLQGLVGQSAQLEELFLLDLRGEVALSTDESQEGHDYADQRFFRGGLAGPYAQLPFQREVLPPSVDQPPAVKSVIVAIPILGQQGRPLGVIAARAGVEPLNDILSEPTGLGETGKAFLVNSERAILRGTTLPPADSDSRAPAPSRADSPGITEAIEHATNTAGIYTDYRGNKVLASYRWLPDLGVVLATEQDLSEGLRTMRGIMVVNAVIAASAGILAIVAALFVTRTIANPLTDLATTATAIAGGDLDRRASTRRHDEIGTLAEAFNSMTAQLRDLIGNLERRVEERTRALQEVNETLERRAIQMETSARVSRELTSILNIDDLLDQVVELIRDAFHYYHVHIFLLDQNGDHLILRASTSPTVPEHHCIAVNGRSINGRAIRRGEAMLVNAVKDDAGYLADQGLPDVESELVAPLRLADQVIGTLDVQSAELNAFTEQDLLVIQSLGDQIAVAIENARLYDRSQELAVLEERTRLARELHDSVTQSMYSVVLLTEGWRRSMDSAGKAQVEEYLARIGEINQQALKEMRLLIHELRPPVLEEDGLLGALHQRLEAVEKRAGVNARLIADAIVQFPHPVEEGLYRIAQEALNNALKHAVATNVAVRLTTDNGVTVLEVEDDGRGFVVDSADGRGGMGLANMRERARRLGGSLAILSDPGRGTIVRATVLTGGPAKPLLK
jgi:nitrate/nitrite-specific signal transduction histidine kinase